METMIFCLFTLLLIWLAWRELEPRSQTTRAVALRGAVFGVGGGAGDADAPGRRAAGRAVSGWRC